MARIFPNPSSPASNLLNLHAAAADIFHALFTLILVLTSAAIILSLCASHTSRKRLRSSSSTTLPKPKPISTTPSPASSPPPQSFAFTAPLVDQPLPPPPIHQALQAKQNSFALSKPGGGGGGIGGNVVEGGRQYDQMTGTVRRKLSVSLSQKLSRNWTRKEGGAGGGGGGGRIRGRTQSTVFDEGDLLWKKQIILGEKCRVPDENEFLGDDHRDLHQRGGGAVINKFPVYRPRTPRSLPVSRTNSHIDLASLEFLKDLNKDVN